MGYNVLGEERRTRGSKDDKQTASAQGLRDCGENVAKSRDSIPVRRCQREPTESLVCAASCPRPVPVLLWAIVVFLVYE